MGLIQEAACDVVTVCLSRRLVGSPDALVAALVKSLSSVEVTPALDRVTDNW